MQQQQQQQQQSLPPPPPPQDVRVSRQEAIEIVNGLENIRYRFGATAEATRSRRDAAQ